MFSKLRSNYKLSNILVRIAFVLAYVLYSWQTSLSVTEMTIAQMSYLGTGNFSEAYTLVMSLFVSASLGVGLMFLLPLLARTFLNVSRFYNVPHAEYTLLAHVFFTLYFVVCGALRLVNVFTPLLLVWGEVLFPVVVGTACAIWFYAVTSKLYFNDVTKPFYFRNMAIVYFVCVVVGVVL